MNGFKTLIVAGTVAAAAATMSVPAQAEEFYVVHPDGRVTAEFTHHDRSDAYSFFSFSLGAPVIWLQNSHRDRGYWMHEQHENWRRGHSQRREWDRHGSRGFSGDGYDDHDYHRHGH